MTKDQAIEKTNKYSYLVGKKIATGSIAAIMPVPIDANVTVELAFTSVFNQVPYDLTLSNYSSFMVAVMFNYQAFLDSGTVIWKDLDDVLVLLEIDE